MRGNEIIITSDPKGQFQEALVKSGQTFKPGMIVQPDASVDEVGGVNTFKIYADSADGDHPTGGFWVVTNGLQALLGQGPLDSSGNPISITDRCQVYNPRAGEQLNLLIKNLSGTADDHTKGEKLMVDTGTGMLIATTGTPETECAMLMETITDPTADLLAYCIWSGY